MRIVRLAASIAALTASGAGAAQYPSARPSGYPAASTPMVQQVGDADNLASEIRLLAADPNNLQALVRAGELALKLEDPTAAAAFFARAARVDPRNARVKAGEGSLLVGAERPGEALRHFAEAEALGGDVRSFAADRALAYDLIGEQDRAQRDYRVALRAGDDDETRRRYALSLGISGKRDLALREIEPLLRKSDRGAWRSRAFILAMSGDRTGAERIATTMMPAGMAQGLQPFFQILPSLRPADRAFAVHFGEVRPSPARIADARMTPSLPALRPDPTAPVEVVATPRVAEVTVAATTSRPSKRSRKDRPRETIVAATTPPVAPLPAPPAYVPQSTVIASARPYQGPRYGGQPRVASSATRAANLAAANALRAPGATAAFAASAPGSTAPASAPSSPSASSYLPSPRSMATATPTRVVQPVASATTASANMTPTQLANAGSAARTSSYAPATATPATAAPSTAFDRGITSAAPVVATPSYVPNTVTSSDAVRAPVESGAAGAMGDQTSAATPLANPVAAAAPNPVRSEDSILAAIIAGINIPGTELGVGDRRMAVTSPPPIARAVPSRPLAAATSPAVGEAAHSSESKGGSGSSASRARIGEHKPVAKFEDEAEAPTDRLTATRKGLTAKKAVPGKAGKADAARGADGSAKGQRTDIDDAGDAPDKTEKTDKTSQRYGSAEGSGLLRRLKTPTKFI